MCLYACTPSAPCCRCWQRTGGQSAGRCSLFARPGLQWRDMRVRGSRGRELFLSGVQPRCLQLHPLSHSMPWPVIACRCRAAATANATPTFDDAGALPQLLLQQARLHGIGVVAPCRQVCHGMRGRSMAQLRTLRVPLNAFGHSCMKCCTTHRGLPSGMMMPPPQAGSQADRAASTNVPSAVPRRMHPPAKM